MTIRLVFFGFVFAVAAAAANHATPAEAAVLEAVRAGHAADVTRLPDRTVRLAFLQDLARKYPAAIEITGAVLPDSPDYLNLPVAVELRSCAFPHGLHLTGAKLGDLRLIDCTVNDATLSTPHIAGTLLVLRGKLNGIAITGGDIGDELTIDTPSWPHVRLSQLHGGRLSVGRPYDLTVDGSTFTTVDVDEGTWTDGPGPVDTLKFDDVTARYIQLHDIVSHRFFFYRSRVEVAMKLSTFDAEYLDLSLSTIPDLFWTRPRPEWPRTASLEGAQFKLIHIESPVKSQLPYLERLHRNVLDFLTAAQYSAPAFLAYQQSLEDRGMIAEANETAFTMHEKWRTTQYDCTNIPRGRCIWNSAVRTPLVFFDLMQQYVFGLGRSVTAPLLWSAVFVACGILIFRRRDWMEPRGDKSPTQFSPSWYSLELFLPVVDLGVAKDWRPAHKPRWRATYARVHQLAGWILIPVAIAALTGGLRK